jgi:membrane-bound lytic murein transglycosylase D
MRFPSHRCLTIALLSALAATVACQSAHRSGLLTPPAKAQAPALAVVHNQADPPQKAATPTDPKETAPIAQAPTTDPAADLITRVEAEYKTGQDDYKAGHLEAARVHFDSAFNQLLGSGLDLHSDTRLERELNRVLDGLKNLDLAASQQDEGFEEPKSEPAPIDEANEATPTVDPKIKAKAEAEIRSTHSDLPLMMNDQVAGFINYFSNRGRGTLERGLERSGRYEDMIRATLRQEGVPQDLIYLAQAESGFHPLAVSRAGARGMWQFMGSRARGYGLEHNRWVDDRQDPEKATRAAARHLKDLYNQFGDWYLAMAAYNSGPGTVQSAVKRTGYADFWELYRRNVLPRETRNYVPIIVAVTIMAKNPEQYGLDSVVKDEPIAFDTVKIDYPIDLRLVAQCVDVPVSDLQDLNPSLLRMTTPANSEFALHLPAGTADKFQIAVASIPVDKRLWWRYHKVQSGDTLAAIARTYHTTSKTIAEANGLEDDSLVPDTKLIIPIAPGKQVETVTYARRITRYKVRRGDTVESVAKNIGVPPTMIRRWNRLRGNSLRGRRVLYVHLPVSPATPGAIVVKSRPSTPRQTGSKKQVASNKGIIRHKVKRGETLTSIAHSYNTTVSALKKKNRNIPVLRPGMILLVPGAR